MPELKWANYPKQGECWITSDCGCWRILKAMNHAPKKHAGWPQIEPVVYVLWARSPRSKWRLVKSFNTLAEAKHAANRP